LLHSNHSEVQIALNATQRHPSVPVGGEAQSVRIETRGEAP
jgi:hypothetical protein